MNKIQIFNDNKREVFSGNFFSAKIDHVFNDLYEFRGTIELENNQDYNEIVNIKDGSIYISLEVSRLKFIECSFSGDIDYHKSTRTLIIEFMGIKI